MLAPRLAQVKLVGKQRLVLDLSCRARDGQYWVVTDRWQRFSTLALSEASLEKLAGSCDEFLVHGVDVEGMQLGIDDELVGLLGRWSPIPVTYAGGARTLVGGGCNEGKQGMVVQGVWQAVEACVMQGSFMLRRKGRLLVLWPPVPLLVGHTCRRSAVKLAVCASSWQAPDKQQRCVYT